MTNGTYLSKDAILKAIDLEYRDVAVPEWGGTVRMREMNVSDRQQFIAMRDAANKAAEMGELATSVAPLVLSLCAVDGNGARLFTDDETLALQNKNPKVVERIATIVLEMSRVREAIAESIKNSETSPSADSPSA